MNDLDKYIRMNENYYYPRKMSDTDIMDYMLIALDIVYQHCTPEELHYNCLCHSHAVFLERVRRNQAIYEVSFEHAACLVVYSILQGLDISQIKLNAPRYDKRHRYGGGMFHRGPKHGMTYKEMYKRWNDLHK